MSSAATVETWKVSANCTIAVDGAVEPNVLYREQLDVSVTLQIGQSDIHAERH
jgi:hypothetical protein